MPGSTGSLYDRGSYAWSNKQAQFLRTHQFTDADIEHIAEEIESMGRGEKCELVNRLAVLLLHLLKWRFQPAMRGNSWRLSIEEQGYRLADHLADNPSLRPKLPEALTAAYRLVVSKPNANQDLPAARSRPPEQIIDELFWPDAS